MTRANCYWVVEIETGIVRAAQPTLTLACRYMAPGRYITDHMPSCTLARPCDACYAAHRTVPVYGGMTPAQRRAVRGVQS